jgi:hypothetical protein
MSKRRWTDDQLEEAVKVSFSYRNVIKLLGLIPAGGNYRQIQERIKRLDIDVAHFRGMRWNVGLMFKPNPARPLKELLVLVSRPQSFVLKSVYIPKVSKFQNVNYVDGINNLQTAEYRLNLTTKTAITMIIELRT